jgi:hypothetical protein
MGAEVVMVGLPRPIIIINIYCNIIIIILIAIIAHAYEFEKAGIETDRNDCYQELSPGCQL